MRTFVAILATALSLPAFAECPSNRTFVVTNAYDIDGEPLIELNLTVGFTYTFTLQNPSSHPFMLTAHPSGGPGSSPLPVSAGVSCFCQGCGTCTRRSITFTPAPSLTNTTVYYQCTVHPAMGNAINILPAPAITFNTIPGPTQVCAGETATLGVSALSNETGDLLYQWHKNGQPLSDTPGAILGANGPTLTLLSTDSADAGSYTCVVTAPCKTVTTTPAPLTIQTCCPADIGMQGGAEGSDGRLDNNDFIAFVNMFFNNDVRADIGSTGGVSSGDGNLDNNDFIVFIDRFFAPC